MRIRAALLLASLACAASARNEGPDPARLRRAQEDIRQLFFGKAVLRRAESLIGTPYMWGDKTGERGFDCSGYTQFVLKSFGVELAPDALHQYQGGIPIERPALAPGDLVFFASSAPGVSLHVGIYAGDGQFLHAPGDGKVIERESMKKKVFADRYIGARRYLPPQPAAPKTATPTKEKKP